MFFFDHFLKLPLQRNAIYLFDFYFEIDFAATGSSEQRFFIFTMFTPWIEHNATLLE